MSYASGLTKSNQLAEYPYNIAYYAGYDGMMREKKKDSLKANCMFIFGDRYKNEAMLLLLTPNSYQDAFSWIQNSGFNKIYLTSPEPMGIQYVSDIFNLMMELRKQNIVIDWMCPIQPILQSNNVFEDTQYQSHQYQNKTNSGLCLEMSVCDKVDKNYVYDIEIRLTDKSIFIPQHIDTFEYAYQLLQDKTIQEVHVPYSATYYGGLSYMQLITKDKAFKTKFIPNMFTSSTELQYYLSTRTEAWEVVYNGNTI